MEPTQRLPKLSLQFIRRFLLGLILVFVIFAVGFLAGSSTGGAEILKPIKVNLSRGLPENRQTLNFSLFWSVWDTLDSQYFDSTKIVPADLVYGSIKGMVQAVGDPYTVFLPPNENSVVQEDLQGNFEGVGIQIGFRGNQLAVIAPLADSPAERAGVEAGDFIIGITDEAKGIDRGTVGISLPEAVQIIRGPAGSEITLTLLRNGTAEPITVEITRASIDVPSLILSFVDKPDGKRVAHLQLLKFGGDTYAEWNTAVSQILAEPNLVGIVLDLRNNPGGFLQGAIDFASEFLPVGKVVVIQEGRDLQSEEYSVTKAGRLGQVKVVVLVNQGSASASEILAGALKDHNRAKLVGQTTFGKGTIQEPQQINGGAALHITVARWLTPNRFWVNDGGIVPDIEVEDDPETEEDEELEAAINLL